MPVTVVLRVRCLEALQAAVHEILKTKGPGARRGARYRRVSADGRAGRAATPSWHRDDPTDDRDDGPTELPALAAGWAKRLPHGAPKVRPAAS
jgi:hypothetical protein